MEKGNQPRKIFNQLQQPMDKVSAFFIKLKFERVGNRLILIHSGILYVNISANFNKCSRESFYFLFVYYNAICIIGKICFSAETSGTTAATKDLFQQQKNFAQLARSVSEKNGSFIDTHCHLDLLFRNEGHTGTFDAYKGLKPETWARCFEGKF